MIKIEIDFFDKKTEFIADEITINVPKDIVFEAAETDDPDDLIGYGFDVTERMKNYIIQNYPRHAKNFELYDHSFSSESLIQRHEKKLDYKSALDEIEDLHDKAIIIFSIERLIKDQDGQFISDTEHSNDPNDISAKESYHSALSFLKQFGQDANEVFVLTY